MGAISGKDASEFGSSVYDNLLRNIKEKQVLGVRHLLLEEICLEFVGSLTL